MRILSIQPSPRRQGPAIQHLNFIKESSKHGIEHYIILQKDHPMSSEFEEACSKVLYIDKAREGIIPRTINPIKIASYFIHVKITVKLISNHIQNYNIDAVWTVNEAYPAGPLAAKKSYTPSCTQVFGMTAFGTRGIGYLLAQFHKKYSTFMIPCQDLIAEELKSRGYPESRIKTLYNAVDTKKLIKQASDQKENNAKDSNNILIGTIAGLDRRKGHLLFIEAAALTYQENKDARFLIIGSTKGDDEYLAKIKQTIKKLGLSDVFTLTGETTNVPLYLSSLDIYCTPSKIEALSVAAIEAMTLGLPIIATDVGGNYITVENEKTGILTSPEDSISMSKAMLRLIESENDRITFGEAGKLLADEKFSLEGAGFKLLSIFKQLEQKKNN